MHIDRGHFQPQLGGAPISAGWVCMTGASSAPPHYQPPRQLPWTSLVPPQSPPTSGAEPSLGRRLGAIVRHTFLALRFPCCAILEPYVLLFLGPFIPSVSHLSVRSDEFLAFIFFLLPGTESSENVLLPPLSLLFRFLFHQHRHKLILVTPAESYNPTLAHRELRWGWLLIPTSFLTLQFVAIPTTAHAVLY